MIFIQILRAKLETDIGSSNFNNLRYFALNGFGEEVK